MIDVQPFIRQAWLDDLRSGEFRQASSRYRSCDGLREEANCCLAVAERTFQKFNRDWDSFTHSWGRFKEEVNAGVLGLKDHRVYMELNDGFRLDFLTIAEAAEREFRSGKSPNPAQYRSPQ